METILETRGHKETINELEATFFMVFISYFLGMFDVFRRRKKSYMKSMVHFLSNCHKNWIYFHFLYSVLYKFSLN